MSDERKTFLVVLIAGAVLRAIVPLLPFMLLMQVALPDDAYYYFDIARNIASGNGITYDGLGPTNGFHPLWLGLLVPVFWLFPKLAAVRIAVALSAAFDVFNIYLVRQVARKITDRPKAGNIAAFVYAVNLPVILLVINAMESAVNITFILMILSAYLSWRKEWNGKRIVLLGIMGGALFLARTDSAIFLVLILLAILIEESGPKRLIAPLAAGAIAALIAGPFLLWNTIRFESPMQVSGRAIPMAVHREYDAKLLAGEEKTGPALKGIKETRDAIFSKMFNCTGLRRGGIWLTGILLIVFLFQRKFSSTATKPFFGEIAALWPLLLFLILLGIIHGGVRWFVMTWYFVPMGALWAIFLGIAVCNLLQWKDTAPKWAGSAASCFISLLAIAGFATNIPPLGDDNAALAFRKSAGKLDGLTRTVPADSRSGAFNTGIIGFYSSHPCANLDGVVNYGAYRAIRDRKLDEYIRENNIRFIIDRKVDFERYEFAAGLDMSRLERKYEWGSGGSRNFDNIKDPKKRKSLEKKARKRIFVLYEVLD
ncbi:MAG: ArnT family glycosyltransferase [Planctomycetota bacterium]